MSSTVSQPRPTEKFSKSFGGSLKSLVGTKGRTYFILEHKTKSNKFRIGQTIEYIGDYIELGRGNSFTVNFGDDCPTVSRPHAAIIRKGDSWILRHLSTSNPTLVNKRPIQKNEEWSLKNGDEIQLSYEGPIVAFLTPVNNSVNTLGMTARLKAVANEAIRPYKTAVISLSFTLLLAFASLGYHLLFKVPALQKAIDNQVSQINNLKVLTDSASKKITEQNIQNKKMQEQLAKQDKLIEGVKRKLSVQPVDTTPHPPVIPNIEGLYPDVYFIYSSKIVYEIGGKTKEVEFGVSGTGFLLNDGKFVTARHVIQPWLYLTGESTDETKKLVLLNIIANNGGKVIHYLIAHSPSGRKIQVKSTDFSVDDNGLISKEFTTENGDAYVIKQATLQGDSDWAVYEAGIRGQLTYNRQLSMTLPATETLYVLGYPFGMGVNSNKDIVPIYSKCEVSRPGLDNGVIDISGKAFNSGNSGGPVFAKRKELFTVVGIVSAERGSQGIIVPISSIR